MRYVIIGNSAAAVGCIEGIRKNDKTGGITVIGEENHHVYGRPLISYLLEGKTDEERMLYRPKSFYEDNGVTPVLGVRATEIDPKTKTVSCDNGKTYGYDKLLIATGSRPFVPPTEGLDSVKDKHFFMTLDDARSLERSLSPEKRVLIIGAGLIGLKCAEGIRARVGSVTVVDMADRVLPSVLDSGTARIVQRHLEENGLEFILSDSAVKFEGNRAILKSGKELGFDILVIAVGVRANTDLIAKAGGKVNRGIVIGTDSQTSIKDIYAAGDCAECTDALTGESSVIAIMPNAYLQGETAGINMSGGKAEFTKAVPMNSVGFFGMHIITAGRYDGFPVELSDGDDIKRLFVKDDTLRGYMLIGNTECAGIYTSLIREKTPLSGIDFELMCKKPTLMAFSRKQRDYLINEKLRSGAPDGRRMKGSVTQ